MILRYRDVKKRNSNFVYDLLTTTTLNRVKEIISNDEELLHFELKINGVEVPIVALERMYKEIDDVVELRAKHKAIKLLSNLKYDIGERIGSVLENLSEEINDEVINYVDELQFIGQENAFERRIREDEKGD